jgi:Domain of unknown function (DUF932)
MNALTLSPPYSSAFLGSLTPDALRQRVPAAFAPSAHESRSEAYCFIPSSRVIEGLGCVGFYPVDARQACRARSALHARHVIRFRRRFESETALGDVTPELIFLNSHDGTSAYQLRVGLYRTICTNGLVISQGTFPTFRVAHRGDVVGDVVRAALEISERFGTLAASVERMEKTSLDQIQRLDFAAQALALRYPDRTEYGLEPARLLVPRRAEDVGDDLWHTLNVVQEGLLRGGIPRRSASNRLIRMRGITSIKEDMRINSGLWDLALTLLH